MKDPYARLGELQRQLIGDYNAEKLHKLRIALRRMRSTLRNQPEPDARQLRAELGLLADTTNAARDWDTLAIYAADVLTTKQFRHIEPWLEECCNSAHHRVIRTLRSEQWSQAMTHWKQYTQAHHDDAPSGAVSIEESDLALALERLAKRRDKALSRDDVTRWHKLRIAAKDFRYLLDGLENAGKPDQISLCKELQDCLGRWHDCVVHDQLLRDLAVEVDPNRNPRAAKALAKLRHQLEQERISSLASAREIMTGAGMTALFNPTG